MGRRKRAITIAINNLNAKKAKHVKDQQPGTATAREQRPVEDDGEIVLWNDVLVEESEEEVEDTDGESVEGASEDDEAMEGKSRSDWWRAEDVQKNMVVRRKYERIPSQPHERTLQRKRAQEEKNRAHVAGFGNIETMFKKMAESKKKNVEENGANAQAQTQGIETLKYESEEERRKRKMMEDLVILEKMLKSKRCEVTGEDGQRHEMVRDFMKLKLKEWGTTRKECAHKVAQGRGKGSGVKRSLLRWVRGWEDERMVERSKRGRHSKVISWLEDERVAIKVRNWVKEKGEEVTSQTLAAAFGGILKEVEDATEVEKLVEETFERVRDEEVERVEKGHPRKVSLQARTAREWLNKMGYRWKNIKKGVFIDGHEREDVVEYRGKFLDIWYGMQPYVREWEEVTEEVGGEVRVTGLRKKEKAAEKEIILVTHDESTFSANDGRRSCWIKEGDSVLRPKGRGRGIMVSEFLTGSGRLRVGDDVSDDDLLREGLERDATVYFEYGDKGEGYWKGEDMVQQVLNKAIPVFQKEYGKESQACFLFDNSSNHGLFAEDALVAGRINLNSGGKQPVMRDGWYVEGSGNKVTQRMWFEDGDGKAIPKGLKQILTERGIWRGGLKLECKEKWKDSEGKEHTRRSCVKGAVDCCARVLMASQQDFQEQKGMLEEEVLKRGHLVLFFPKFHCECNWIEYFWGDLKRRTREQCDYSWDGLKRTVPRVLESTDKMRIWRWYRKSTRIISAYREGLVYGTKEFQERYKSHRRVKAQDIHV